jgi:putative peptidoglycan lipid II flippase
MTEQRKIRGGLPGLPTTTAAASDITPAAIPVDPAAVPITPEVVESPRLDGWQPRGLPPIRREPSPPPAAVAGDVVLTADVATSDLSAAASARMGGRAIALAGVVVVVGVVLARLLGWLRTAVFFAQFGGSNQSLDSFFFAFRIPDTLFQLVAAGAVGSALVPVASGLLANGEPERARRLIATVTNLMILALIPLAILIWIAAPTLVGILFPTSDPGQLDLRIGMTRLMILSPVLLAVGAVMTAGLNATGRFGVPAMASNVYNVGIIVCAVLLTPFLGIYALALGVVVGAFGLVITQALAVRQSGLYAPELHIHDPAVRETLLLMAPRAFGLGVTQLVFLVNSVFLNSLPGNGPNSWYTGAFTALQIPVGLIGVPLGIVLLPPLSQAIARGDDERFRRLVDQSLRLLLFVVVPMTGFMLVLARPTIAVLYQHGSFSAADTASTTPVYAVFLLGLVAHVLIALLAPIFYAGKDTRTPVTAALLAVLVDVGAAIVLFPFMHLLGLALAISLGAWAEVALLVVLMERRIGFDLRPIARHAVAFGAAACVASAAAYLAARVIDPSLASSSLVTQVVEVVAGGLVGLAVYAAWARVFRLPEFDDALNLARTLIGRTKRDAQAIAED